MRLETQLADSRITRPRVMIIHAIIERQNAKPSNQDYGQNVGAMGLETLDHYLHGTEATPLSRFMHKDTATLEEGLAVAAPAEKFALERRLRELRAQPDWHDPNDGLASVETLIARLPHDADHAGFRSGCSWFDRSAERTTCDIVSYLWRRSSSDNAITVEIKTLCLKYQTVSRRLAPFGRHRVAHRLASFVATR